MDDIEGQIYEWAKDYAEKNGLKLNPDYDVVVQATYKEDNLKKNKGRTPILSF